ncbi:MAG: FUSC family protein [Actinobacteria bacterium]|nr:FUSC family protein [Actinomycetota bacterium]
MTPRPLLDPRSWWADAVTGERLLLAAKTAAAAVLAWYLAPLVPLASSEYSYYAPLGVLVSMYPTVARSAMSGAQAILGLAVGIGLGLGSLALVGAGMPRGAAVAVVIGLGVLLSGVRALGVGRDWVAIAALFVLLLGGADPDGYSVSYLVTMAFGVLVGVAVNLLVFPPLRVRSADRRLTQLRDDLASDLDEMARALAHRQFDPHRAGAATQNLARTLDSVRAEVDASDESRRYNPRGRRVRDQGALHRRRLDALAASAEATRTLTVALTRLLTDSGVDARLPGGARTALADAIAAQSRLVEAPSDGSDGPLAEAADTLDRYIESLGRSEVATTVETLDGWDAAISLRRMTEASREFAGR